MIRYFNLTQPQMRIWEMERFFQGTPISNIGGTLLLQEELDFDLWEEAIHKFIESNDSVRLHIRIMEDRPVQYLSEYRKSAIPVIDFTGKTKGEQEDWLNKTMRIPFDVIDMDLFKFYLLKCCDGEQGYLCVFHHMIADAWTISLLGTQTMESYKRLKDRNSEATERRPSYLEYIRTEQEYLNSQKYLTDREYWLEKYKDRPNPLSIKSKNKYYTSSEANRRTYTIEGEQATLIRDFCSRQAISPAVLFEGALCIYLGKFLGHWNVSLGSLILNRSGSREKAMSGMFISTVPLKIHVDQNGTLEDLCRTIGKEHMEVFRHQKYPLNMLLPELRKIHKTAVKLYDFSVSYQNSKIVKTNYDYKFRTTWYSNGNLDDSFCMHIDDRDGSGTFVLHFDYRIDFYTESEIDDMYRRIMLFMMQGIREETIKIESMELIDDTEKDHILKKFNNTLIDFPKEKTFHELFEAQVERTPDKIALRFENKTLTYRELNSQANRLARLLKAKGVRNNSVVGLMITRSMEMIIGILGVLKAGGAYLPIDTGYPPERIKYILNDSRVGTLIIQSGIKNRIDFTGELIEIDDQALYREDDSNLGKTASPEDLVYIIYTSGSTGDPKGVMVTHKNLVNAAFAWINDYCLNQINVRLLQIASFSFDVFAGDLSRALLSGGEMVICQNKDQYNPKNLYSLINQNKINIFESTPALIIPLMNYVYEKHLDISSIKILIIGSDTCPINSYREIVERFGAQMRVLNSYGVTEATIDTSYYEESLDQIPLTGSTPIGKPMPNMKLLIMNEHQKLLPVGVYGELCIGGAGVTKGYINKPGLTAEKFVRNPYDRNDTLYRTGDLARLTGNGNVEFMGRIDSQVKIRGFRIELGEIESQLLKHESVKEAVVVAKVSQEGNKYLCGYIVSPSDIGTLKLREYLQGKLPEYMVPSYFVQLDEIPLSPNGKVERTSLPDPDRSLNQTLKYAAPRNQIEREFANICCEVMELERIGIDDNLFELGADSLSIIQIQIKTYAYDWNLTMQDFYQYPTIRKISDRLNRISAKELSTETVSIAKIPAIKRNHKRTADDGSGSEDSLKTKNILLTGATGYLGIHILNQLLSEGGGDIYCLVRGKNNASAKSRLLELLVFYFADQDLELIGKRVFAVTGDISRKQFGLSKKNYEALGKKTDIVIHSAANVKHYGNYAEFQKANVIGTQRMIEFADAFSLPLNHISTVSVSGDYIKDQPEVKKRFTERDFYIGQNYMDNLYVRSKFEAENLVLKAMENGLSGTIFRMGNLTGRYLDGKFQQNISENAFYNRLKTIINIKAIPKYVLSQKIEFTPVDYAGKIVAILSMQQESRGRVFHIFNHNRIKIKEMIEMLNALSLDIEVQDKKKFSRYVKELSKNNTRQDLLSGIINDLNGNTVLNYRFPVEPESRITRNYMSRYGLQWPEIDFEYIKRIISHMKQVEYI